MNLWTWTREQRTALWEFGQWYETKHKETPYIYPMDIEDWKWINEFRAWMVNIRGLKSQSRGAQE